jgi:hypothetical protein
LAVRTGSISDEVAPQTGGAHPAALPQAFTGCRRASEDGPLNPREYRMSEQRKYRKFTAEQKVEIVLAGLRGDRSVRDVCREHQIAETLYYGTGRADVQMNAMCTGYGSDVHLVHVHRCDAHRL